MARRALCNAQNQLLLVSIGAFLLLALVGEFLADAPRSDVPPALAVTACSTPNPTCLPGDSTKTSLHHVQHNDTSTDLWVEPEDGDRCDIVAYWNTNVLACQEYTETASVYVNWDGSSRRLDDVSLSSNIAAIDLCADDTCSPAEEIHSWGYWFIVDIEDPVVIGHDTQNLQREQYQLTEVDDGHKIYLDCTLCEGQTVSFKNLIDGFTDNGPFNLSRCPYRCDDMSFPLGTNYYG